MCTFYTGTIESVLTRSITVWYGACSASCRKTLQRIMRAAAEKIVWCPPAGSEVAAVTSPSCLAATAHGCRFNNKRHGTGPIRTPYPRHPRNAVEALPEVGVEDHLDRFFLARRSQQTLTIRLGLPSIRHPSPPCDPTHHQVLIS
ncbi:hypothetical protein L3Q82_007244 [Scortum barcoo]|uniref:Uncharacterized protein n=1 Tax=Scortum barcoo TaxID=214431 RepID=A0ACB8WVI4_9TELE|nr:hypothetical protein L3Q82_007244 [Scortum barcoo]